MNPIGAAVLLAVIVGIFTGDRRRALLSIVAGVLYLTQGQAINVLGLNLFAIRFIELAGFIRVMSRHEYSFRKLNDIDRIVLLLYGYTTIIFLLRSKVGYASIIGASVDAWLCFFTFRGLVRDVDDLRGLLKGLPILLVPFVILLVIERETGRNFFAFMGAIDQGGYVRHGIPRCMGSFRHPVLLGTLGATFLPLYIGLALSKIPGSRALLGIALCLIIVWTSNSGGPLSSMALGLVGWSFWLMRRNMRLVRWGLLGLIGLLDLVMKAPIWYILARVSSITGGTGWHRAYLIDVAVQNLGKWWLAGMPISQTADWFPYTVEGNGAADITNEFIAFGLSAGLGALILFVVLLTRCYRQLGVVLKLSRSRGLSSKRVEYLFWGLGVMVTVHIINWLGITYFDQTYVLWFLQLACIASACQSFVDKVKFPGKGLTPQTKPISEMPTRPSDEEKDSLESEIKVGRFFGSACQGIEGAC